MWAEVQGLWALGNQGSKREGHEGSYSQGELPGDEAGVGDGLDFNDPWMVGAQGK